MAPTAADYMAGSDLTVLQGLVYTSVDNSIMENYLLQPIKIVIFDILNQFCNQQDIVSDLNINMNGERMSVAYEYGHPAVSGQSSINCEEQR